jgi:hypothetical protein
MNNGEITKVIELEGELYYNTVETGNYENLINLPKINGIELIGDKSSEDLDIFTYKQLHTTIDGNKVHIRDEENNILTFQDVVDLYLDPHIFVYCLSMNVVHIPAFNETNAMAFMGNYTIREETHVSRVIINSEDDVHLNDIQVEDMDNKTTRISARSTDDEYPTAKAVYNKLNTINEDLNLKEQSIDNLNIEVENLTTNINLIVNDIDTHTEEINTLENNLDNLSDLTYTKDEVDDKVKGFATTSSLIAGINGCEPKMADTVDYVIETGIYGEGESGYRKYKNGFIEQWGVATTNASETEFRMHKPHIDIKYSIFIEVREQGDFFHYAIPNTNQNFKARISDRTFAPSAIKFQWRSFGRWK